MGSLRHRSLVLIAAIGVAILGTACSKTITTHSGDKGQGPPRSGASSGASSSSISPSQSRQGEMGGGASRGASSSPMPSLSEVQAGDPADLGRSHGEQRITDDAIVTAPSTPMRSMGSNGQAPSRRGAGAGGGGMNGEAGEAAMLSDVYFGFNSAVINEPGIQRLLETADWLRAHPTSPLVIEGHCDERGTNAYNLVLGEKRARAIKKFLLEQRIDRQRVTVVSYGKERPFCVGHDEECYQQNRRGHLVTREEH